MRITFVCVRIFAIKKNREMNRVRLTISLSLSFLAIFNIRISYLHFRAKIKIFSQLLGAFAVFDYFPSYFYFVDFIEIFSLDLSLSFFLAHIQTHTHTQRLMPECDDVILMSKDDAVTTSPCIKKSIVARFHSIHTHTQYL